MPKARPARIVDLKNSRYDERKQGLPARSPSKTAAKFFGPFHERLEKVIS
jgi:hypothetical protein